MKILRNKPIAFAFTLAEVLITLAIIGVVAAMVIPALINNATKTETVSQLKKAYSTLSGAYTLIANESDGDFMATIHGSDKYALANHFFKYMNVAKDCNTGWSPGRVAGCFSADADGTGAWLLSGISAEGYEYFDIPVITADGIAYDFYLDPNCSDTYMNFTDVCGWGIWVDVNGPNKGKAQLGRDIFLFELGAKEGVFPYGAYGYGAFGGGEDDCKTNNRGTTCAYKILKEGAINY